MIDKVEVVATFQRQGLVRAMYLEAARWVGEQGLQLHASKIQTSAAKAVWAGLVRDGLHQWDETGSVARFRPNLLALSLPSPSPIFPSSRPRPRCR